MNLFHAISALSVAVLVSGCGGGGSGNAGSSPFSASPAASAASSPASSASASAVKLPTLALNLSSTSVSSAAPATATATVRDALGQPVAGQVVSFSSPGGLAVFSVPSALTNAQGQASVSVAPSTSTASGADTVRASADIAGTALSANSGFQLQSSNVTLTRFSSGVGNGRLSAYGQTALTVEVAGASIGSPVNIALSSSCLAAGKATLSPATFTTTTPATTIQYKDNGCGALQTGDRLQASIVGSSAAPVTLDVSIASPAVNSIAFLGATPSLIFLKGSGLGEVSQVSFELRDANGNPLPNQSVTMTLATAAGGVTLEGGSSITQLTDSQGRVSARVNSGTVPTPVRVVATVGGSGIQTVSSGLSVAVGLPSQLSFSLSQQVANIEGGNRDGVANTYTIIASDRSGNPVPDGTSINFVAEGGQIEAVKQTQLQSGIARTSANFVTSDPRPTDGRITVTAYALGEESFLDLNGDNVYTAGEPFQDLGNVFKDRNYDGVFNGANEEFLSLNIDAGSACTAPGSVLLNIDARIPTVPNTCDSIWGRAYVRRSIETILSTSQADPVWVPGDTKPTTRGAAVSLRTDAGSNRTSFDRVAGSTIAPAGANGTFTVLVRDANGERLNPVAAGSSVSVSSTQFLTATLVGGSPVSNSQAATSATVSYEFDVTQTAPGFTGTVTLVVTSPSGASSASSITLTR